MGTKQDQVFVRTASQLEQKLGAKKSFKEVLGLINDTRDKVDSVESRLQSQINEQYTTIMRDTEAVTVEALKSYVKTDELAEYETTVSSRFTVAADQMSMEFEETNKAISEVDDKYNPQYENLKKHIEFSLNGIDIRSSDGEAKKSINVDDDGITLRKNGVVKGYWDGDYFYTGNLVIRLEERAQFGNFAYVPRSNGNVSCLKVGG